jgi:hypothetical protein
MNNLRMIAVMVILFGITSVGCGLSLAIFFYKRTRRNNSASGTITHTQLGYSFNRIGMGFNPGVEFTDNTGAKQYFTSRMGTIPSSYKEGDTVKVLYDPHNPCDAEIASGFEANKRKILIPFLLLFGLVFSCFSSILLLGAYLLFSIASSG